MLKPRSALLHAIKTSAMLFFLFLFFFSYKQPLDLEAISNSVFESNV